MASANLHESYGVLEIGVLFATFLQGVLSVQAYIYYERFPNDSWKLKSLVAGVWCIDLLHLVFISQNNYHYLVTNWGNVPALGISTWQGNLHSAVSGVAIIMCQLFFLHRIWVFSDNRILVVVLACLCLTTFALDIVISTNLIRVPEVTEFSSLTNEAIVLFSMGAGTDIIMALLLCYYIRRARTGFEKTDYIVTKVIRYTITTGLATSMLAIGCVIAYFASPNSLNFIAIHFSLGRAYTNALLANLNSRQSLQIALEHKGSDMGPNGDATATTTGFHFRSTGTTSGTDNTSSHFGSNFEGVIDGSKKFTPECPFSSDHDHAIKLHAIRDEFQGQLEV